MLKKIISVVLLMSILISGAHASSGGNLKSAFDELSYALTVEWDQKDEAFFQQEVSNFATTLTDLRKSGLSQAELGSELKKMLGHKADAEVDQFLADLNAGKMGREEAMNRLNALSAAAYAQGANFLPRNVVIGIIAVPVVLFAVSLIIWELSDPQIFGDDGWK